MRPQENEGPSVKELEKSIRKRDFHPVYMLYGEEETMINDIVGQIVQTALDENTRQFNLDVLDGAETTAEDVLARALSFPMMGERRVIVVREFDRLGDKEKLAGYAAHPSKDTILVLVSTSPDFRKKEIQAIRDSSMSVRFPELREVALRESLAERAKSLGKNISPDASDLLIAYVGRSLAEVRNALDKTALYTGSRTEITSKDVNDVIGRSEGSDIFELQRHLSRRDPRRAMESLFSLLDLGESPIGIIVMLTRYFQRVWCIEDAVRAGKGEASVASTLGIPSFTVKEYLAAAKVYSVSDIERIFSSLERADEQLKSSAADPRLVMTLLLTHIVGGETAG
jgi:DNA polymerase-3 subunit delta